MKKFVAVTTLAAALAATGPVMSENVKVPKMDESKIIMSTQSSQGDWVIPMLLLLLVAAAVSSGSSSSPST